MYTFAINCSAKSDSTFYAGLSELSSLFVTGRTRNGFDIYVNDLCGVFQTLYKHVNSGRELVGCVRVLQSGGPLRVTIKLPTCPVRRKAIRLVLAHLAKREDDLGSVIDRTSVFSFC